LAHKLGIEQGQVSKWDSGSAIPSAAYIAGLALALGVPTDRLLEGLAHREGSSVVVLRGRSPSEDSTAKTKRARQA